MVEIIQQTLLKNKVNKNCFITLPVSLDSQCLKQLAGTMFDSHAIQDFNKKYTENDFELLRYYLTLYPKKLITNIKD